MVIAVDFDGTCVTHEYPNIGMSVGAEYVLKPLSDAGHQLILYTMRCNDVNMLLDAAVDWFKRNEIKLYGVNENPTQKNWTKSPKVYANMYIDDAAFGCPLLLDETMSEGPFVDWMQVARLFTRIKVFTMEEYKEIANKLRTIPIYKTKYGEE